MSLTVLMIFTSRSSARVPAVCPSGGDYLPSGSGQAWLARRGRRRVAVLPALGSTWSTGVGRVNDEEGEVFAYPRVDGHRQADAPGIDHASDGGSTQAECDHE